MKYTRNYTHKHIHIHKPYTETEMSLENNLMYMPAFMIMAIIADLVFQFVCYCMSIQFSHKMKIVRNFMCSTIVFVASYYAIRHLSQVYSTSEIVLLFINISMNITCGFFLICMVNGFVKIMNKIIDKVAPPPRTNMY